jgi:phosphoglycerate dehydrogenase-like enzyme
VVTVLVANSFTPAHLADLAGDFPSVRFVRISQDGTVPSDATDGEVLVRMSMWKPEVGRVLTAAPGLRWIHSFAAGSDHWFVPEIVERGVRVTRASSAHGVPIAEFVLAFILHVTKRLPIFARDQARHEWRPPETIEEVRGKTVGVVGAGAIGREVALRCHALGMRVIGIRRRAHLPLENFDEILPIADLTRLLSSADYVVVSAPSLPQTRGMIAAEQLRAMRPSAYLINVARGALIVEEDLARAVRERWIAGACLDAFVTEPLPPESPLWDDPNIVITPHSSFRSPNAIARSLGEFRENLDLYLRGEPLKYMLDFSVGY